MAEDTKYIATMNELLLRAVKNVLWISLRRPSYAYFAFKTILTQRKAARLRLSLERSGVHVPPYLIASITNRCNLRCKSCFAQAHHRPAGEELSAQRWREVMSEAEALGISVVFVAGGEPLVRKEILDISRDLKNTLFVMFTNGLLIDEDALSRFKKQPNTIPMISMEGVGQDTDVRRGAGVYARILEKINKLRGARILFGVSITVTRDNYETVTSEQFLRTVSGLGAKIIFFIEFIPVEEGTGEKTVTDAQRESLGKHVDALNARREALFVQFPGDEKIYDGCLAAGRGFVHIGPGGELEPCPFAPFSDTNIKQRPLKEALQSLFLKKIRDNHCRLDETGSGCALWENRRWVQSLLTETSSPKSGYDNNL
ncbi:MAG: hypothetical protein A2270_01155 [Elusimicrobia bacterium RIFOXYA12_FULL_51_18]|nr:MAG: hypothetical protein A2270_01155 [Elusimicrobia bacterium RIFOXYA12_FULL_51_18]OGS31089.1 MAG: hypothetical protein A2218_01980 [Elusimicrobia bacterium RIFOXYA2_FULL_53_38]